MIRFFRSVLAVNSLFFLAVIIVSCGGDGVEIKAGVTTPSAQIIFIDASAPDGGDGSLENPYNEYSDINWTSGGENSIEDWVSEGYPVIINLKRGEVWREMLNVGTSGAPGRRITIQPYGNGNPPVISGYGITIYKNYITIESVTVQYANNNGVEIQGANVILTSVTSTYNAGNGFLVRGPNSTLTNCTSTYNTSYGLLSDGDANYGFFISGGTYSNNGNHGIMISMTDDGTIDSVTASSNGTTTVQGDGININSSSDRITVSNNTCAINKGDGISSKQGSGASPSNITIENNKTYGNNRGMGEDYLASGIRIDTNTSNSVIRYNKSYNNESAGIVVEDGANNISVYYNLVLGNNNGITHSNGAGSGNTYYNNVAYNNISDGFQVYRSTNTATIKNNIFYGNGRYGMNSDGGSHTYDYNCVSGNKTGNYNGFSKQANDIILDPLMTNPVSNDFTLQGGSPLIDAGTDVKLSRDIINTIVPFGNSPDIGAYEYVP